MKDTQEPNEVSSQEKTSSNPSWEVMTFDKVFEGLEDIKGISIVPSESESKGFRVTRENKTLFYLIPLKDKGIAIKGKKQNEEIAHQHKIKNPVDLRYWYDYAKNEVKK